MVIFNVTHRKLIGVGYCLKGRKCIHDYINMLYTGTGLCVILVNSTKFLIICDTLYVASVAEKWLP